MIKSLYIHIPFCKKICSYCDFTKFCYQKKWIMPYLESLKEEIKTYYKGELLKTIYIGGGTPTSLDDDELEYLLNITNTLNKDKLYEFTVEANVSDLSLSKIKLLKKYGVNRVSLGIQTFNKELQKTLNRKDDYLNVKKTITNLKNNGICNINLDLMYAIPKEKEEDLKLDLEHILSLDVPHISTYSLILEPNTLLYMKKVKEIDQEIDAKMYDLICKTLKKNGYNHYEVSNFSKPNYESKHNLTYWNNDEYYGFGLGASGYIENKRYTNHSNLTKYINKDYTREIEIITLVLSQEYDMILGLRKLKGVSNQEFFQKYHKNIEEVFHIKSLLKEKLLVYENDFLRIPEDKIYLSNEILINFLME